ncbi:MAG: phospholipase A [Desulfuromonadales bacterium]
MKVFFHRLWLVRWKKAFAAENRHLSIGDGAGAIEFSRRTQDTCPGKNRRIGRPAICCRRALLILLLLGCFPLPAPAETAAAASLDAGTAVRAEPVAEDGFFRRIREGFSLYRENYLLPLTWPENASSSHDAELKFQFSFMQQIWRGLTFAYTQKSFWRVLDQDDSRPFRETNYNPELFYRLRYAKPAGLGWGADVGIEHESNGSREPDSRSWNRVYVAPVVEYGPLQAEIKLWRRLSEDAKETPEDPSGDENPDIVDYYGYGELRLAYTNRHRHRASLMTRWNFATEKGALELAYSIPTGTRNLFIYGQFWTGYGESLIDYNRSLTRYGIGMLIRQ